MLAQDNLPKKLERHDAFRSRIAVVGRLDPLSPEEMRDMIAFRLATAGGGPIETYFEEQSLADVHAITKGIPRDVCVLVRRPVCQRLCPRPAHDDARPCCADASPK